MTDPHRKLYSTYRWKHTRLRIFERDGYRCRICGCAGKLECHHEPPVPKSGPVSVDAFFDPARLLTVCSGCHVELHRKRSPEQQDWQDYLDELS